MNKAEFRREYRKWRTFMRGQSHMHHGGDTTLVCSDASDMAFHYFYNNAHTVIRDAILNTSSSTIYCELSKELTKEMFHIHALLNMRLPSSFRRD